MATPYILTEDQTNVLSFLAIWLFTIWQYYPAQGIVDWYNTRRPWGCRGCIVPSVVFAPIWILVSSATAIAIFSYWKDHRLATRWMTTMILIGVTVLLSKCWSPVFFSQERRATSYRNSFKAWVSLMIFVVMLGTGIWVLVNFAVACAYWAIGMWSIYLVWMLLTAAMTARYVGQDMLVPAASEEKPLLMGNMSTQEILNGLYEARMITLAQRDAYLASDLGQPDAYPRANMDQTTTPAKATYAVAR